jgi:hypothetical protein
MALRNATSAIIKCPTRMMRMTSSATCSAVGGRRQARATAAVARRARRPAAMPPQPPRGSAIPHAGAYLLHTADQEPHRAHLIIADDAGGERALAPTILEVLLDRRARQRIESTPALDTVRASAQSTQDSFSSPVPPDKAMRATGALDRADRNLRFGRCPDKTSLRSLNVMTSRNRELIERPRTSRRPFAPDRGWTARFPEYIGVSSSSGDPRQRTFLISQRFLFRSL